MRLKISTIVLLTLFAYTASFGQKKSTPKQKISNGKWVLVQDTLSSIVVKNKFVSHYYENKALDTTTYTIVRHPCDSSYKSPNKKALYLLWNNGLCHEVIGITNNYIELVYTLNGKTITYRRVN